jgi:transcription elongation GreA/GreB family factor
MAKAIIGKKAGDTIEWRSQQMTVIAIQWEHGFSGLNGFTLI